MSVPSFLLRKARYRLPPPPSRTRVDEPEVVANPVVAEPPVEPAPVEPEPEVKAEALPEIKAEDMEEVHWTLSMTKTALLVVAAARNLDVTSANTKAEIVTALEASDPK